MRNVSTRTKLTLSPGTLCVFPPTATVETNLTGEIIGMSDGDEQFVPHHRECIFSSSVFINVPTSLLISDAYMDTYYVYCVMLNYWFEFQLILRQTCVSIYFLTAWLRIQMVCAFQLQPIIFHNILQAGYHNFQKKKTVIVLIL